jgi:hypothetical protein
MNRIFFCLTLSIGFMLSACGESTPSGKPNEQTSIAPEKSDVPVAMDLSKMCHKDNDDKKAIVEGFLDAPSILYSCSGPADKVTCGFDLKAAASDEEGKRTMIVQGTGNNKVEKYEGKSFDKKKLALLDNNGKKITINQKVKITGEVVIASSTCWIDADKIEAL